MTVLARISMTCIAGLRGKKSAHLLQAHARKKHARMSMHIAGSSVRFSSSTADNHFDFHALLPSVQRCCEVCVGFLGCQQAATTLPSTEIADCMVVACMQLDSRTTCCGLLRCWRFTEVVQMRHSTRRKLGITPMLSELLPTVVQLTS